MWFLNLLNSWIDNLQLFLDKIYIVWTWLSYLLERLQFITWSWLKFTLFILVIFYIKYTSIRNDFGARIYTGSMWVGKSFKTFLKAFYLSKKKKPPLIIANVPYPFVNIFFESQADLDLLLNYFLKYMTLTNELNILSVFFMKFRPIYFILDESHLYYFSTDVIKIFWWDKWAISRLIYTQLRKRFISVHFITQVYAQLASVLRRLVPFVTYYFNFLWFLRIQKGYVVKKDDTDLKDKNIATSQPFLFRFFLAPQISFIPKEFKKYHYLSHYVIDVTHSRLINFTFDDFYSYLSPVFQKEEKVSFYYFIIEKVKFYYYKLIKFLTNLKK